MTDSHIPDSVVIFHFGILGVHNHVQVCGAPCVVARKVGVELDNTVRVRLLDATEKGFVEVWLVIHAVAINNCKRAAIYACGIGAWTIFSLQGCVWYDKGLTPYF